MLIRCWGARGSIPVSGQEYLKYGGDTTCMEIRTKDDEILIIDAGSGLRRLGNRLLAEKRRQYTMLFTHAHWDHLVGFPFFRPIYIRGTDITLFGCPFAQSSIKELLANIMTAPHFPVNFEDIRGKITYHEACDESFTWGSLTITPIPLSHPNQGVGYKIVEDGKSFVFLTDNELAFQHEGGLTQADYLAFSRDADLLIHDAEYTERDYHRAWGHSRYGDALDLALQANAKMFGLFHHNQERSDDGVDAMVDDCRKTVSERGSPLQCFALHQDMEIHL